MPLPGKRYRSEQGRTADLSHLGHVRPGSGTIRARPEAGVLYVVHDGDLYTYTAPLPPNWNAYPDL